MAPRRERRGARPRAALGATITRRSLTVHRVILGALVALIVVPGAAHASSRCHSRACEARVAAKHARWDAHWCARHRTCRERVAIRASTRRLTPYPGPNGTHWAIPYYIVACESHGRWDAYNPSGASGPYQLLGWGAPMPANTPARRLAHHRIAARLWNGGRGRSQWVCA